MDVYKLRQGLCPVHAISMEQFEAETQKQFPWYQKKEDESLQYAVCPACDNPIQLIALYRRRDGSPAPYGRHVPKSIQGIATYSQESYDTCPYANPGMKLKKTQLRSEKSVQGKQILQLLRQEFDRIIYLLQKMTGIIVTEKLARDMLQSFLDMRGYLYVGTNICNLPWSFCYMTTSQILAGRIIKNDSPLMNALKKDNRLTFNEKNQVVSTNKKFISLFFTFIDHKISTKGADHVETIKFIASLEQEIIFENIIEVEPMHFHNLVNLPPKRAQRNEKMLKIAEEMIRLDETCYGAP